MRQIYVVHYVANKTISLIVKVVNQIQFRYVFVKDFIVFKGRVMSMELSSSLFMEVVSRALFSLSECFIKIVTRLYKLI